MACSVKPNSLDANLMCNGIKYTCKNLNGIGSKGPKGCDDCLKGCQERDFDDKKIIKSGDSVESRERKPIHE